ncbi:MAG: ArnT family glycosyltransferase [Elusimicrobiota bacterium]
MTPGLDPRTTPPRAGTNHSRRDLGAMLALCALTLVLVAGIALLNRNIEFDRDEGFTLVKAWLLGKGHPLYSQIWSDQPPGMTVLLMPVIKIFGNSLLACRCFVGLFAALLVASFYSLVRQTTSTAAAFIAALLLFYSPDASGLMASVMIGLPSLACAVLAAKFLLDYGRTRKMKFFFLSLFAFCLSLQIKFIAVIYLPGLLVPLLMGPKSDFRLKGKTIAPAAAWMSLLLVVTVAAILYFAGPDWRQLVGPHVGVQSFGETSPEQSRRMTLRILLAFLPLAPLLILSGLEWRRRPSAYRLIPFIWFACAMFFLLVHKPIRYHYGLNLAVPVAWLVALALPQDLNIMPAIRALARGRRVPFTQWAPRAAVLICIPLWLMTRLPLMSMPPSWAEPIEPQIIRMLSAHKSAAGNHLFTDRPMYAFISRIPMPPALAVISGKRLNSGYLPSDYFMGKISRALPEHVILYRLPPERFSPGFPDFLADHYRLVYRLGLIRYYLRN